MGVTVVGGVLAMVLVSGFTDDNDIANVQSPEEIELVGYDTRDGPNLSGISTLDNNKDSKLCTVDCNVSPNNIPASSGTDFIVITLHNPVEDVWLSTISVSTDYTAHSFDELTIGIDFDASVNNYVDPADHEYPDSGKYSLLPENGLTQRSDTKIVGGEYVRAVIKLDSSITQTIEYGDVIPISVSTTNGNTFKFFLLAGSVK
jgi:hypothetical protein